MQIPSLKRHFPECLLTRHRHFSPLPVSHRATEQGARLRAILTGDITLIVWPYRRGGLEYLMCDGFDACQTATLTLRTGGPHDFRCQSGVWTKMGGGINESTCQWISAPNKESHGARYKTAACPVGYVMAGTRWFQVPSYVDDEHVDAYCCH